MAQIYAVSINSFPLQRLNELLHYVPGCERLTRYVHAEDRIRSLLGQMLIRKLVADAASIPFLHISFIAGPYGKPALANGDLQPNFNLSHSGEWVLCAISDAPIGVDVEQIATADLAMAKQFFAPAEYRFIAGAPDARLQHERFFAVWTAKESYIKAVGMGLSLPLDSFTTVADGRLITEGVIDGQRWHFASYALSPNYAVALCSASDKLPSHIVHMKLDALLQSCQE
jgi:4'-phosphopantetheinyl transferase